MPGILGFGHPGAYAPQNRGGELQTKMEIFLFIVLAVIWALFLIPSLVDSRNTPARTTREFAQDTARMASVHAVRRPHPGSPAARIALDALETERLEILARRRRTLTALILLVGGTLAAAIVTASLMVLFFNLLADVLLAGYVAVLLQIKQQRRARAAYEPYPLPVPITSEQAEVRVIAG